MAEIRLTAKPSRDIDLFVCCLSSARPAARFRDGDCGVVGAIILLNASVIRGVLAICNCHMELPYGIVVARSQYVCFRVLPDSKI